MSRKEVNLNDSFSKLMHSVFPVYLGKIIERTATGYKVFDIVHHSWEEATKAVDRHFEIIEKSIKP